MGGILMTLYVMVLFFLLSPGVLVSIPPRSGRVTTAFVHAIVFGIVWYFTHKMVWLATGGMHVIEIKPTKDGFWNRF
jgi:hypothetical protein